MVNINYSSPRRARLSVTRRKDGTVVITERPSIEYFCGEDRIMWDHLAAYEVPGIPTVCRDMKPGDEGCLVIKTDLSPNAYAAGCADQPVKALLFHNPEGFPGNMDGSLRNLHGWRGTTCDICVTAYGWRKVLSISPLKRGIGDRIILSADLKPHKA